MCLVNENCGKRTGEDMDIRRTVLLADANEEFRTLVRKIIDEAEEFSVVGSVGDGTEALRLAREEAPDLILMDVVLPGLDGFGVLKQLREQEGKVPKVILISAFCSDSGIGGCGSGSQLLFDKARGGERPAGPDAGAVQPGRPGGGTPGGAEESGDLRHP